MANVTIVVNMYGPSEIIDTFVDRHIWASGNFDFATVVPPPPNIWAVEHTEAPIWYNMVWWAAGKVERPESEHYSYIPMLHGCPQKRAAALVWLDAKWPQEVAQAMAAWQFISETGCQTAKDWRKMFWGTPHNALWFKSDVRHDRYYGFSFDTLWEPPTPIFRRLAALWPSLSMGICAEAEERIVFKGSCRNGHLVWEQCPTA